ncbi:hypothetical protein [Mycetocola reblochoni]|uniref:hypothetical protein n=1 Tax=Mycetocola reblochoni TaxID=331618 RepID=UPI00117EAC21|nr:hypothetical protein [Mycetocola reblochoni]
MNERTCVRGCTIPGEHTAQCLRDRVLSGAAECAGCLPVMARPGVLVCQQDWDRFIGGLEIVADLVAHLRTVIDPMKAAQYGERVSTSRVHAPAPLDLNAVDAADQITQTVIGQAEFHGDETEYHGWRDHVPAGASAELAYMYVGSAAEYLIYHAHTILNGRFAADTINTILYGRGWTIHRATERWPRTQKPYIAEPPCPSCGMKTIIATPPPIPGDPTSYECRSCPWAHNTQDDAMTAYLEGEPT